MLKEVINKNIDELIFLVNMLDDNNYQQPIAMLSYATIGQHTRHIIEMFQCLAEGYDTEIINYDNRRRNKTIETNREVAIESLSELRNSIKLKDKSISLENTFEGNTVVTKSSYKRELLYNLEHSIHHQALIKVALIDIQQDIVDDNFGVAQSTLEYRKKCVQ